MSTNFIGLPKEGADRLGKELHHLLANYEIFYQNVRGFHWNVRGPQFFELHAKFEELYNELALKIDVIAERMLTLGATPDHRFSSYTLIAEIEESPIVKDGTAAAASVLSTLKALIVRQRMVLSEAAQLGDEGTASIMSDFIKDLEKHIWMYAAYLD